MSEDLSKTQESIKNFGDKSYYYWHDKVPATVPIEEPPLIEKKIVPIALPVVESVKKIQSYIWFDDGPNVKVYIELDKVGNTSEGVADLPNEKINCKFTKNSFDLTLLEYKKEKHRLLIENLNEEIDHENSTFKKTPTKIIISLKKKGKDKWYDLTKKLY